MSDWIRIPKAYREALSAACGIQVVLEPAEVKSERFHVRLTPLPHPGIVGNGRVRMRLRASVSGEIPPTDRGISDALGVSLKLGLWFDGEQSFRIADAVHGIAFHREIREDDELFTDLADDRSYSYDEHWLVELEFNYQAAAAAVAGGA